MKNPGDRWEIIFAGSGGQGLGMAGQILAEAAMKDTGCNAAHNQSYGARARGGSSQSSLIISCEEIIYPLVTAADLLLALTPDAYLGYESQVAASGVVIYDSSNPIKSRNRVRELGFPLSEEALKLGNSKGITLVALGTANQLLKIVDSELFLEALSLHFRGEVLEQNKAAFIRGQSMVSEYGVAESID